MAKKMIVMDMGNSSVHIIKARIVNENVEIENGVVVPIPPNCFMEGRIEDEIPLRYAIKTALSSKKIKGKNVIITVHGSNVIERELVLPSAIPDEIGGMVYYEMEQTLPKSVDEFIVEYRILDEIEEDGISKYKIRAAAMPRDMAEDYYSIVKNLKLNPVKLDIHSNSIAKLFVNEFTVNDDYYTENMTTALIDIGARTTTIHIIYKEKLEISRTIALGGRELDMSISKFLNIPLDKAEKRKIDELNLIESESSEDIKSAELLESAQNYMNRWTSEIQKVFQYYLSRNDHVAVNEICLFGGGSNIRGITEHLEKAFNIHTVKIENTGRITFKNDTGSLNSEYYINAAGAML